MKSTGLLTVALAAGFVGLASPAGAVLIQASDTVGSEFTVNFNGLVGGTPVTGLSSTATFAFGGTSGNSYLFSVELENTSSPPISSRVSVLGFNVDPDLVSATVSGLFDTVGSGNVPGFGDIEVCFKDGGGTANCAGGGGGGVTTGASGTFDIALIFGSLPTSITLSDFVVRYQSIEGTTLGTSGIGVGTEGPPPPPPTETPEPGTLALLGAGLLAIGGMLRRRAA